MLGAIRFLHLPSGSDERPETDKRITHSQYALVLFQTYFEDHGNTKGGGHHQLHSGNVGWRTALGCHAAPVGHDASSEHTALEGN